MTSKHLKTKETLKGKLGGKVILAVILVAAILVSSVSVSALSKVEITAPEQEIFVEAMTDFSAPQANTSVSIFGIKFSPKYWVNGKVDTTKLGTYDVTFKTGFLFNTKKVSGKVTVVDTTAPTIYCEEENIHLQEGKNSITAEEIVLDYTAFDTYDGELTNKVQISVKNLTCTLSVTDSSGNTATKEINIIPNDHEYPTLMLKATTCFVRVGSKYVEPGYTAHDSLEGDLTSKVKVKNNIDTSKSGEYRVEYSVTDTAGNTTKMARKVVVYGSLNGDSFADVPANGKTVYLTFDDGPGPYTDKLLGYLDQYGVKATFFVTNQFPAYQKVIKNINQKGHAIGIHTATHKWSIYSTDAAFYDDFNQMQSIIKAQTGKETNIFRFPGGTNNGMSSSNKGVMTRLSTDLLAQGYHYFDWNVDCNDARTSDTQEIITQTINQISQRQNAVVLMHDIKLCSVEAVPAIIEYCLRNGYTFAPLTENSPAVRFKPIN